MLEGSLDTLRHGNPDYTVRFSEDITGAEAYTNKKQMEQLMLIFVYGLAPVT